MADDFETAPCPACENQQAAKKYPPAWTSTDTNA